MPYPVELLQRLSAQGIFRKYEFVLELESGFGGRARWAARQFGCQVLGVEPEEFAAVVARELGLNTRSGGEAVFCSGHPTALPFRSGVFTHVWWLWPRSAIDRVLCLQEVHRVLRDGGYFAWVLGKDYGLSEDARQMVTGAGFVITEIQRLEIGRTNPWLPLVRRKLEQALRDAPDLLSTWGARLRQWPEGESLVLLFARRGTKQQWT